jgi:hypothetical protein
MRGGQLERRIAPEAPPRIGLAHRHDVEEAHRALIIYSAAVGHQ